MGWQRAYRFHLSLRSSRFILPVRRLRHSRDRCVDDFVRVLMDKRIRFRANELDTIENANSIGGIVTFYRVPFIAVHIRSFVTCIDQC